MVGHYTEQRGTGVNRRLVGGQIPSLTTGSYYGFEPLHGIVMTTNLFRDSIISHYYFDLFRLISTYFDT